ncbi:transcription factor E2F1 [Anguilla rostrata]|uniref:transcription factor E2F1 n=1 Tax=Anguilla rostrata TaxID=7938 RepID=UPI0030D5461D
MSETLITGLTSEDLLADFESILSSGNIDLSEEHQIVIISTPNDVDIHSTAPNSAGEILLFATPQGSAPAEDPRRPTLGRPPVKRKLDLDSDHQYVSSSCPAPPGRTPTATPAPPRVPKVSVEKSRYDTSLNLTTKRFLDLLAQSPDGVVDLNWASQALEVQKRRIYDITNVLEGIHLISKKSKNNIQWLGNRLDGASAARQQALQKEVSELTRAEDKLDELIAKCNLQLRLLTEDSQNKKLGYVMCQDLRNTVDPPDQLVMVVRAPPETQMEVSEPSDVFLCPEDSSGVCSPVTASSPAKATGSASPQPAEGAAPRMQHARVLAADRSSSLPAARLLEGEPFAPLGELGDFDLSSLVSADYLLDRSLEDFSSLPLDSFINLSPPHVHDYHFGLEEGEGVSELFDCDFGDLAPMDL